MKKVLVTGAGGFIGTHLVRRLVKDGHWVRGVDIKYPEWSDTAAHEFRLLDLRMRHNAHIVLGGGFDWVFHLAADMGGMGFITTQQADIILNNTLINSNMVAAVTSDGARVGRFLFSSSACIYPKRLQSGDGAEFHALREPDAYPADPQETYGWEKLHMEHMLLAMQEAGRLDSRIVRFHNCYGTEGSWQGGREKAPAALSRKIAKAKLYGVPGIEVWGDGLAERTYMHVNDCIEGIIRLMESDFTLPMNLGRDRMISVNHLVFIIAKIAETEIEIVHVEGPQGVRRRNSDNTLCNIVLEWEPGISVEDGLVSTYKWVEGQVQASLGA